MDTPTRVQILDETGCISHSTNTLGKGMNPIILPPAMVGQTIIFSLGETTSLGEGNSEFKPVKIRLKIDLVSYPARAEGVGQNDIQTLVKNIVTSNFKDIKLRLQTPNFSPVLFFIGMNLIILEVSFDGSEI